MLPVSDNSPKLTRRGLLRGAAGTAGVAGVVGASALLLSRAGSGNDLRPNVLWIITDDQTRRMLKVMPKTMERLVTPGVNFVNGYTAIPWCGPSRASMLTGMYPHNHRAVSNVTLPKFLRKGLDRDTVATRMKDAGYTNGYFGKYMNGHGKDPTYVAAGWDRWVTTLDKVRDANIDGRIETLRVGGGVAPDRLAARTCREFVHARADESWFAVFAPTTPHDPYTPSAKHKHAYDDVMWDPPAFNEKNLSDKPSFMQGIPPQDHKKMRRIYEGKLEELQDLDDQIDELIQTLEDTGQLARTVIMLVSDNGYLLGEHRLFQKKQPYEESTGVPIVVYGPGFTSGQSTELVSTLDLMSTTLDVAGLDPDAGRVLDGRSLLPNLRSGDWSDWRKRIYSEDPKVGWSMLREGDFAFIDNYGQGGEVELYDLASDPYQMRSIASEVDTTAYRATTTALRGASGSALRALET